MVMGTRKRSGGRRASQELGDEAAAALPIDAERQAVVTRLFDGVLRSAENHLCRTHEPLAAEVWASGLLAVWDELPGPSREASGDDRNRAFGDALVRHARAQGRPEALAVLLAVAGVAPTRLATMARTAATGLTRRGVPAPVWAEAVGVAVPTEAWVGRDVFGDQEIVIIGFDYPENLWEGGEHTICVLVDHNLGGRAKDAYPAGPLAATLARWQDAKSHGIRLRPVTLAEAAGRLADALVATEFADPDADRGVEAPRRLAELRWLLAARLGALPLPVHTGLAELDHDARQEIVADFLSSPEAADLLAEPATVMISKRLVDFRCDHGDGDPLRWSPTLAGMCLLDHFPERIHLDPHEMALVPDVAVAWIRFAGRRKGLPAGAVGRTVAVVESCRDDFAVAMGDEERFGPTKRLSMEMQAEGIDLTDDQAVSRWIASQPDGAHAR